MIRRLPLALLLLSQLLFTGFLLAQEARPDLPARLEFIYTDMKHIARLDGSPLEATDGMKVVSETSHGKHLLEIYAVKGLFKVELLGSEDLELPGGYITRVTLQGDEAKVLDRTPTEQLLRLSRETTPSGSTTVTTTTTTQALPGEQVQLSVGMSGIAGVGTSTTGTASVGVTSTGGAGTGVSSSGTAGIGGVGISMQMTGMGTQVTEQSTVTTTTEITTSAEPDRLSRLVFISDEGMCEIYLDGKKKLELPMSGIDEAATGTIFDLKPGSYLLKIEGFEIWYDGTISIGSGEEIKIKAEPSSFQIVARNRLP